MPIVWALYSNGPLTFSALKNALGASRETLSQTLENLTGNGVIARPPARRGTYSLTDAGQLVGESCGGAVRVVQSTDTVQVALKKWPMLVLTAAGRGAHRYGELIEMLPGITPRALAQALRDLEGAGLVTRVMGPANGRSPSYELTDRGRFMFPELDDLVRACDDAMEAIQRRRMAEQTPG